MVLANVSAGQDEIKLASSDFRVFVEGLIKISEPEEEEVVEADYEIVEEEK